MGVKHMTGTAWHVEKAIRAEGDERRHKSRCIFYNKESGHCKKVVGKCCGSAHCQYYEEATTSSKEEMKAKPIEKAKPSQDEIRAVFPEGRIVRHKEFGLGVVMEIQDGTITVAFNSGKTIKLGYKTCVENKLLVSIVRDKAST